MDCLVSARACSLAEYEAQESARLSVGELVIGAFYTGMYRLGEWAVQHSNEVIDITPDQQRGHHIVRLAFLDEEGKRATDIKARFSADGLWQELLSEHSTERPVIDAGYLIGIHGAPIAQSQQPEDFATTAPLAPRLVIARAA